MANLTRSELLARLGYASGFGPASVSVGTETEDSLSGVRTLSLRLETDGRQIPAILLKPVAPPPGDGYPGILYCHAHGSRYDIGKSEVVSGRPALLDPPLGLALARAGYAVLCADMPVFGDRQAEGTESALSKAALWQGHSLLGDMLRDQSLALVALTSLPDVDATRTAAIGISMGGTLAYFAGALFPQIHCVAHMCVFAELGILAQTGALDLHGIYMVVPGLLASHDVSDVAALIAPRPQLMCYSPRDPLTPVAAAAPAIAKLRQAYAQIGAPDVFRVVSDADAGHREVPEYRSILFDFLAEHLKPTAELGRD